MNGNCVILLMTNVKLRITNETVCCKDKALPCSARRFLYNNSLNPDADIFNKKNEKPTLCRFPAFLI